MIAQPQNKPTNSPHPTNLRELAQRYQQILTQNPRHPEALAGMSLVALATRQHDAAVRMAQAAVAASPQMATAWIVLGQALRAANHPQESSEAYRAALHIDNSNTLAHTALGELNISANKHQEALLNFTRAHELNPNLTAASMGIGNALACMDRFAEALTHYQAVLAQNPRLPEAHFAAGFALQRIGKPQEAENRYRRAIALRPDFAAAWMNLGCLLREQGRDIHAEAALNRAVELRPDLIAGWINLALLKRELHRMFEAEQHLQRATTLNPHRTDTHIAWTQFYIAQRDLPHAWEWLHKALTQEPDNAEAINMRGILLHNEERFAEAVEAFERAESLGSQQAISNRGNSLLDLGRVHEALEAHARASAIDPNHSGSRYNLALTQLRLGDWLQGWQNYEARWYFRDIHRQPRTFDKPRLTRKVLSSKALNGARILLHTEQGLGDTIQFCRYANLIAERGGFPILHVQAPVERLMRSMEIVRSSRAEVTLLSSPPPSFDYECPLMSLPALFGTTVDTVPNSGPYLSADCIESEARTLVSPDGDCGYPRIGMAWAGNPRYRTDAKRSTTLSTLLPLLKMPGIEWIALQKGDAARQLAELPSEIRILDAAAHDRDLADTAATISTLDLVITTDTSIAHLVGAMGKPVWILLPHLGDWRWMQEIETTPWYPTAKLIRQPRPNDWQSVIHRAIAELKSLTR